MEKHNLIGFKNEIEKTAMPRLLMKAISPFKAWRAGVRGQKSMLRQVDREIRELRLLDPKFDAAGYKAKRMSQLERQGAQAAKAQEQSFMEGAVKQKGMLSKLKTPLLLGGAAAAGLYAVNKINDKAEEDRQRMLMQRGFLRYQ